MATTTKTAAKKPAAAKATAETSATAETKTETANGAAKTDWMSFSDASNWGAEWTAAAKEHFETMLASFNGDFEELRAQAEDLSEEVQARFKATQARATETNAKIMEAAKEEVSDAVQLASDLTNAKTFADALTVHQSYWTKLFETRMERARELTEATVEAARETLSPVEVPFANFKSFEKFFAFPAKA